MPQCWHVSYVWEKRTFVGIKSILVLSFFFFWPDDNWTLHLDSSHRRQVIAGRKHHCEPTCCHFPRSSVWHTDEHPQVTYACRRIHVCQQEPAELLLDKHWVDIGSSLKRHAMTRSEPYNRMKFRLMFHSDSPVKKWTLECFYSQTASAL